MVQDALDDSKRHTEEILERVRQTRESTPRKDEGLEIHYSPEDDFLTATQGKPRPSVSLRAGAIYLLVDPDSGEVNALEVPFFLEAWREGKLKGAFWDIAYRLVEAGHYSIYIPPKQEQERAGRAFQDLIPA
ncbi:MAG TPA: hypothetical protein VI876_14090 [Dehalococcoidia bacterium]|nr:hypothetical protein [Dehalococcoidia bacterium]